MMSGEVPVRGETLGLQGWETALTVEEDMLKSPPEVPKSPQTTASTGLSPSQCLGHSLAENVSLTGQKGPSPLKTTIFPH